MSDQPLDRKDQILDSLHAHLRARTRRRRAVRATVAALPLVGVFVLSLQFFLPRPPTVNVTNAPTNTADASPQPVEQANPRLNTPLPAPSIIHAADSTPSDPPRVIVTIARTEPLPTTPCDGPSATVCILSDDQLIAALAEAGQPSGLVRTGGAAYIVPRGETLPLN